MTSNGVKIRNLSPSDYDAIIRVVDDWWGGRRMASMLPRLFFEHFTEVKRGRPRFRRRPRGWVRNDAGGPSRALLSPVLAVPG